ncbi:hypothetical protein T484DRAFT_1757782 [Baffinella frigidus]|nr:hypothetical protein T484DRAFT_1757782 [Cryptophyta sp. CCMP2293]
MSTTRKRPYWQTTKFVETRSMKRDILCMVGELYELRAELQEKEREEYLQFFLEKEITLLVDVTEIPFYTDNEEELLYKQLRARAVDVENAILCNRVQDEVNPCLSVPEWRRHLYDDILERAREISTME